MNMFAWQQMFFLETMQHNTQCTGLPKAVQNFAVLCYERCDTHECCDLGKNRAISLFCRLCKHSTGATAERTRMLGALAVCEGAVDTYMWYHKVYELITVCQSVDLFSHRYLLYSHLAILKCWIKWLALFPNLVSSLAVCHLHTVGSFLRRQHVNWK